LADPLLAHRLKEIPRRKKASKAYDQVSDAVSKGRETFDDARAEARH
jgi:hypothetical protein